MKKQYYQSQYILNKVYHNTTNIIRTTLNTSQDYLNAVFDPSCDAIRVNMQGGVLPVVPSVDHLPEKADDGQLCPVLNQETECIDYYQYDLASDEWIYRGSTVKSSQIIDGDQKNALQWLTQHLEQVKDVADYDSIIHTQDITLLKNTTVIQVQGENQNIDDDLDGDNDNTTPYRIDFKGYILNIYTYPNNEATVPDRYYTRITYESTGGGLGMSHIYLSQDEYDYFANLEQGKNIIRVYYVTNSNTSPIKRVRFTLNTDDTVTDTEGNIINVYDEENKDGDSDTTCCISCSGYVLGIQTYATSQSVIMDKYYTKMVYESDGIHAGKSYIYIERNEYDYFANLENGKNIMDLYYVSTVFPASVTISETQFQLPLTDVGYVAIDASGNVHNITDDLDKDNDPTTHIRISMNGYVLDMDGYENENDTVKKRMITKMSYNPDFDTTDVYLDKDYYEYVSHLGNGRNIISIYTIGAGIGIDASKIQLPDNNLDTVINQLQERINQLENEINQLKG